MAVVAYLGSFHDRQPSQDALLVTEDPHGIVLAVADGVTPTPRTPVVAGADGARFAACTVLDHIRTMAPRHDLRTTFEAANRHLIDRFGPRVRPDLHNRDRPQAAAVAARIVLAADGEIGDVTVVRAADCDVWTRSGSRWSLITTTPMFRAETQRDIHRWVADNPAATFAERLAMERTVITGRSCWNLTALGRFTSPKLRVRTVEPDFDELVLVTDGPHIRQAVAAGDSEPSDWLTSLRSWEAEHRPEYKRHDDVALLHLTPAG